MRSVQIGPHHRPIQSWDGVNFGGQGGGRRDGGVGVREGDAGGMEGRGRDSTGASGGDDGGLSLLEEPLDGLAVGLMA